MKTVDEYLEENKDCVFCGRINRTNASEKCNVKGQSDEEVAKFIELALEYQKKSMEDYLKNSPYKDGFIFVQYHELEPIELPWIETPVLDKDGNPTGEKTVDATMTEIGVVTATLYDVDVVRADKDRILFKWSWEKQP